VSPETKPTAAEEQGPSIATAELDEVRVELRFEVGELGVTVGVIRSLQPGYVFELESNLECPVVIRANGLRLATGRLVQVGTRLGVLISEVITHAD
jgi:flagellar motor switch/type III secretory pathway protein FliN